MTDTTLFPFRFAMELSAVSLFSFLDLLALCIAFLSFYLLRMLLFALTYEVAFLLFNDNDFYDCFIDVPWKNLRLEKQGREA